MRKGSQRELPFYAGGSSNFSSQGGGGTILDFATSRTRIARPSPIKTKTNLIPTPLLQKGVSQSHHSQKRRLD